MDPYQLAILIRTLFAVGMIGLLVIEGLYFGRRDADHSTSPRSDASTNPEELPGNLQRGLTSLANRGRLEANDPEAIPAAAERRAA